MSIVVDLEPDTEAVIREHAAAVHMDLGRYVAQWIGVLATNPELATVLSDDHEEGKRDAIFARAIKIAALRRDIEEFGRKHKLPSLPDEALTREAIYQDHD